MFSLPATVVIASRTGAALSTASTSVRRCERSGPMTMARMRWKCTRSTRPILRNVVGASFSSCIAPRSEIGGENCTTVPRPFIRIASRRRKRPTTTQFSENRTLNQPSSLSGARPTKIETGTSCRSVSGFARNVSSNCARVVECVCGALRRNSHGARRASANIERFLRRFATCSGRNGSGNPASRQARSRISVSDMP